MNAIHTLALPVDDGAAAKPDRSARAGALGRVVVELVALGVVLAGFVGFIGWWWVPAMTHPDANGYWAQGSLFADTGRTWFRPESPAQYVGMHWLLAPGDVYISRYPPGLAVAVGVVFATLGPAASVVINPVLATLVLVGVYLLARRVTSPGWALVAVAALGSNAAFAEHALANIAHMPVAFCLVWGIWLLLRSSDSGRVGWVFAAGLVMGCIPTLRYPDAVVALGVAAFLLMHLRRFPRIWLHYLAGAVGAAIPVVPLLVRNHLLLGAFWRSGYSLSHEQTGFSWGYLTDHAIGYLQQLQGAGLGVFFALGLAGMVWMICQKRVRALGLLLLLATVPFLLVYMAYYWAPGIGGGGGPGNMTMRFLVPLLPIFVVAGVWTFRQALGSAPRSARIAVPLSLMGLQVLMYGPNTVETARGLYQSKVPLAVATAGLSQVAAPGDVVVSNPGMLQHLDFVRRWKLADPSVVDRRGGMPGPGPGPGGPAGDEDAPSPGQREKMEARMALYSGSQEQRQAEFLDDVVAWANGRAIWVVGSESQVRRLLPGAGAADIQIVKRLPTPKAAGPRATDRRDRFGPPMPGGGPFGGPGPVPFGPMGDREGRDRRGMRPFAGGGGPFGPSIPPGEDVVIARYVGH